MVRSASKDGVLRKKKFYSRGARCASMSREVSVIQEVGTVAVSTLIKPKPEGLPLVESLVL